MGVSIYYSAERDHPLTEGERTKLQTIIDEFNQAFPYKEEAETLDFYSEPSPDYILQGSTKLHPHDEDIIMESIAHWLEALTQLRLALPNANWEVLIEDCFASWVDDHWEM